MPDRILKKFPHRDITVTLIRDGSSFQFEAQSTSAGATNPVLLRAPKDLRHWGEWNAQAAELFGRIAGTSEDILTIANAPQPSGYNGKFYMNGGLVDNAISDADLVDRLDPIITSAMRYLPSRPETSAARG